MDVLKSPFSFRVDLDYGAAAHNKPNEPPVDNPGTPQGLPKLIARRRKGITEVYDKDTDEQLIKGAGKRFESESSDPFTEKKSKDTIRPRLLKLKLRETPMV